MHVYNEIEPNAVQWLKNLAAAGEIPAGEVDARPIQEINGADIKDATQFHTFAGIGGWPLALKLAGWPGDREVWTGSCPCQPFSSAGKGKGEKDASDISGPISYALSPSGDLQRSLESRLRARLDVDGSLEYALTWKHWDTESGSPICALRASARRISDKDFTGWPTCRSSDIKGGPNQDSNKEKPTALYPVARLAGWATAAATTWGGTPEAHLERKRKAVEAGAKMGLVVSCLDNNNAALAGWPTTTTRDSKETDAPNRQGAPSLCEVVRGAITELFLVPTGRRVVLAPEFSLWLMGFPEAWALAAPLSESWREAQAALELECSKEAATPSSPSSPHNLSEPISKPKNEEKSKMNELLTALTDLAKAATAYLEKAANPEQVVAATQTEKPAEAPRRERKPRAAAATKAEVEAKVAEPVQPDKGSPADAEKVKADAMAVTRTFVTSHADKEEGKKTALAIIAKEFNGCNGMSALLALPVGEQERYISIIDEKLRALNGAAREAQLA